LLSLQADLELVGVRDAERAALAEAAQLASKIMHLEKSLAIAEVCFFGGFVCFFGVVFFSFYV
jgi:hypothetical protein